jgi:cell division cycle protein 20 (cofactor of APC complex)
MNMLDLCRSALVTGEKRSRSSGDNKPSDETPLQKEYKRRMLSTLCNIPLDRLDEDAKPTGILSFGAGHNKKHQHHNPLHQQQSQGVLVPDPFALDTLRTMKLGGADVDAASQLSVRNKVMRKVPSAPMRILDAPDIVDDYYLNLISWSKDNILAVALARSVYLWNAATGDINRLISVEGSDYVTSVCWCHEPGQTRYVAVGTHTNAVHLFDGHALTKLRTLNGARGRIASLCWSHQFLSAGDRDATIINHDVRSAQHVASKYKGHTQEVCGLKWNEEGTSLASGGNENYLCLWDAAMSGQRSRQGTVAGYAEQAPRLVLKQHRAAVKALDWCPFHRGLLASGGGTADRSIKFWNAASGVMQNSVDTGSQVCSIVWSKHQRELCSSHGYSENQLILWKYPSMVKIKELTGHTARVLNMDISPDGASVVSAGADETLRFWNIFDTPSSRSTAGNPFGELSLGGPTIR